ncbi:alpha/beta hydrolase [Streptomyces sp. NPDC018019]|uniref:alpha/beta hydrolase n=1 Tax=Streptomyces sp. NPDC018019 TaxID=3365030 RepID=UPI003797E126
MPENFHELLKQDFSDLEAAVTSWRKLAGELEEAQVRHRQKVTGPLHAGEWRGADSDTAFMKMEASETQLGVAQSDVSSIATVLDTVHVRMKLAQDKLRQGVRDAEADGYAVDDHGTVTDSRTGSTDADDAEAQAARKQRAAVMGVYQGIIQDSIDSATKASWEGMQLLQSIDAFTLDKDYGASKAREGARKVADSLFQIGDEFIPSDKDPKENAKWWAGLTPQERQLYIDAYPEKIGWLDGIPSTDRDEANRKSLDISLSEYDLKKQNGELGIHDERQYGGLRKLQDALDKADGSPDENKRLFVLGIDTKGDGRAVVAQGNPDTARNVAVQVPGTDNDLANVDEHIDRIGRLQQAARSQSSESTAVVSWLGYDAPEADGSMVTSGRAEAGAGDLRSFTHGLRESHTGDRAHMTVLGHSYGSTMVGAGATGGDGLDVDDIVSVGSPGMTVDHAKDLHIDPDHVWAGYAKDDLVSTIASDKTLGENPADKEFGGKVFGVDTSGHGGYWDQKSESLRNQGRIIVGRTPSEGDYRVHPKPVEPKW